MLGGVLGAWEERISGRGVPAATLFSIWSRGPVAGAVICLERIVLGELDHTYESDRSG